MCIMYSHVHNVQSCVYLLQLCSTLHGPISIPVLQHVALKQIYLEGSDNDVNTQNQLVYKLHSSSEILTRKHNVLETGRFHLQVRRGSIYSVGSLSD
jgi:hypothetical protein